MAIEGLRGEVTRLIDTERSDRAAWLDDLADHLQQSFRSVVRSGGDPARRLKDLLHGTWMGHPLHAALTDVPIGAWGATLLFDLLGDRRTADRTLLLGTLAAVPTALAGAADWSETEGKQRRTGVIHALLNSTALTLFIGSILARRTGSRAVAVGLSTSGFSIATLSAWLGGHLVYSQGTGVNRNAWVPLEEGERFRVAARADALVEGGLSKGEITVDGQSVPLVLLKQGQQVLALNGTCNHWGGPLADGKLVNGDCVECPWHGSTFNMRDGSVVHGPATMPQPRYEARIRAGNVEVRPRL